jgi:hypothetical protein
MRPWFSNALRVSQGDNVGRGFFDNEVTRNFQRSNDRSFPASRSAGEDVSFHIRRAPGL